MSVHLGCVLLSDDPVCHYCEDLCQKFVLWMTVYFVVLCCIRLFFHLSVSNAYWLSWQLALIFIQTNLVKLGFYLLTTAMSPQFQNWIYVAALSSSTAFRCLECLPYPWLFPIGTLYPNPGLIFRLCVTETWVCEDRPSPSESMCVPWSSYSSICP